MNPFTLHTGLVLPIDRPNVDTDAIIPKQFLKSIQRSGFGVYLFDEWRYLDVGQPGMNCDNRPKNPQFVLNQDRFQGASILLARENFGCGSSREHAVWALADFGIRALIAPSYSDIFFNNCFKNGILPIQLPEEAIEALFQATETQGFSLTIDLVEQTIHCPDLAFTFEVDPFRKHCLLNGFDEIGLTLQHAETIREYEAKRRQTAPWLFV